MSDFKQDVDALSPPSPETSPEASREAPGETFTSSQARVLSSALEQQAARATQSNVTQSYGASTSLLLQGDESAEDDASAIMAAQDAAAPDAYTQDADAQDAAAQAAIAAAAAAAAEDAACLREQVLADNDFAVQALAERAREEQVLDALVAAATPAEAEREAVVREEAEGAAALEQAVVAKLEQEVATVLEQAAALAAAEASTGLSASAAAGAIAGESTGAGDSMGERASAGESAAEMSAYAEDNSEESAEESASAPGAGFAALGLSPAVMKAIMHEGFEQPTPIQERSIPVILAGRDMIGQAQTGTGKTAAFALPILSRLPAKQKQIYALVLEPTRELALQVAESFVRFAHYMDNFRVAPIYGGASYESQIRSLRHGAQVVVATPGRLMDLIEQGRLDFSDVAYIVIDEADEMLRMGFIDDVNWILEQIPSEHQTALFSATMPPVIKRIATAHLNDPEIVHIESHTTTATTVRQRYWVASGAHKIDAMTRMLEVEPYDAVIVFVRTKTDVEDVANKLMSRGFACAALHGDIPQRHREQIITRLKKGSLDIIIATDVAARGLDVDRITHVFNYDIPYDAESYVHRIGRTGRAGRTGEAILFVSPRERKALRQIERVTRQKIEPMRMPSIADVNKCRLENFRSQILDTIEAGNLEPYQEVISDILSDDSIEPELLAAALAKMVQRDGNLLLEETEPEPKMRSFEDSERERGERSSRFGALSAEAAPLRNLPDLKMVRYRLAVGRRDGVKPSQIVGAIANEGNLESKYIGEIIIFDTFTIVDLPSGMPKETKEVLDRKSVV